MYYLSRNCPTGIESNIHITHKYRLCIYITCQVILSNPRGRGYYLYFHMRKQDTEHTKALSLVEELVSGAWIGTQMTLNFPEPTLLDYKVL